jgi:hypothetical protein
MAQTRSITADAPREDTIAGDEASAAAERGGESQSTRNLFDLRVIIGGLFTVYGIYLVILGIFDDPAAIQKAAGVRINLWAGIGMLVMSSSFLLWAKLRPLTLDRIVESQADSIEAEVETDQYNRERAQFTTAEHRARERGGDGASRSGARRAGH